MKKDRLINTLGGMGLASVALGCAMISMPLAFIVVGTILLIFSIVGARLL